ncbi:Phosphatidylinositol transfer protein sfh5 [Penicillium malachiteum]|uniref:Phosphatidylinositol transfer protein SFH5 n=1 Tax=Penicillium malachiteum TaxID=1324776 RepID=A0AAD6HCY2_9EURO|nr:Phosphatidylinositol transfer protein sfh5 [Penicillium malachiteum]
MSARRFHALPVEDNDTEINTNEPAHETATQPMQDEDVIEIVDIEPAHEVPARPMHDQNVTEIADTEPAHEAPTHPMYDEDVIGIVHNEPVQSTSEQTIHDDDIIESIDNKPVANPTVTMPLMASSTLQHTSRFTGCFDEAATLRAQKSIRWDNSLDVPKPLPKISAYDKERCAKSNKVASIPQIKDLDRIVHAAGNREMWGVTLRSSKDIPTANVLIKFLRANDGNLQDAEKHLKRLLSGVERLSPRRLSNQACSAVGSMVGWVVISWNIYDQVKTAREAVFSPKESIKLRIAQVEMAVMQLQLRDATAVTTYGPAGDPYRIIEIHDCSSLTSLPARLAALIAIKRATKVVSLAYPEVVQERYFVGAASQGWLTSLLSRGCNFHQVSSQVEVANKFPASTAEKLPKVYGGKGPELKEYALQVTFEKGK